MLKINNIVHFIFLLVGFFLTFIIAFLFSSTFFISILIPSLYLLFVSSYFFLKKGFFADFIISIDKIKTSLIVIFLGILTIFLLLPLQNYISKKNINFPIIKNFKNINIVNGTIIGEKIVADEKSGKSEIICGPYLHLPDGIYCINLSYTSTQDLKATYKVTIKKGRLPLKIGHIKAGYDNQKIYFSVLDSNGADIEFKIFYEGKGKIEISKYEITPYRIKFFFILNILKNILNSFSIFMLLLMFLKTISNNFNLDFINFIKRIEKSFYLLILLWATFFISFIKKDLSFIIVNIIFSTFILFFSIVFIKMLFYDKKSPDTKKAFLKETKTIFSILLFGLVLRVAGITNGLPEINLHPDEMDLVERALNFFVSFKINPTPFFHLGTYSYLQAPLYAYFTLIGIISGKIYSLGYWLQNPHNALLISRFFSVIFSLLSIFVGIKIGTLFHNKKTGYLTGLFMAICNMDVKMSHIAKSNTLIIFAVLASIYFILKLYLTKNKKNYFYASIFIALAGAIKLNNLILIFVLTLAHILSEYKAKENIVRIIFDKKILLSIFLILIFTILFNPLLVIKPNNVFKSFITEATMGSGFSNLLTRMISGWKFHFFHSLFYGSGITLFFTGILGLILMFKYNSKKSVLLFLFPFMFFILLGSVTRRFPRYADVIIPFLMISSGFISSLILDRMKNKYLSFLFIFSLLIPNLIFSIDNNILLMKKNNTLIVAEYINKNISSESTFGHIGDFAYSKVTTIKNKIIEVEENKLPDYLIVYYVKSQLSEKENLILNKHYEILKYFRVDKTNNKKSISTEIINEIKTLTFDRYRCDIAIYKKVF